MKTKLSHCLFVLFLFFLFLFFSNTSYSQVNFINSNPLNCSAGSYYSIAVSTSNVSRVYEMNLNDSTVFNVVNASNNAGYALAIANNLNGGNFSPTFFTNDINSTNQDMPVFFDSLSWQATSTTANFVMGNAGGNEHFIFYTGAPAPSYAVNLFVLRYDGISINSIYQTQINTSIAIPDLAVDANSNIWFFTRSDSLPFFADSLNVIDSTGNLLHQYDTNFDITNAFGMCIIKDTIYIGFGPQNSLYPNKLVSVVINGNTVSLSTSASFNQIPVSTYLFDLASCSPGIPTGFKEIKKIVATKITLYPNPAKEKVTVGNLPANAQEVTIINNMGAMLWRQALKNEKEVELNTSRFAPGMYAVCVKTNKEVLVKKFIKD